MAPSTQAAERLRHGRQGKPADVFSLGCLLFYVITGGSHPFGGRYERDRNILIGRPSLGPVAHMPEAAALLRCMLDKEPGRRPAAEAVAEHPAWWAAERRLRFLEEVRFPL